MRIIFFILFYVFLTASSEAYYYPFEYEIKITAKDTGIHEWKEDSLIKQVIGLSSTPEKEKADQLGQLTRFGFKNLFSLFDYNPTMPYSSQVNPHAELFMRDYLNAHQGSLLKMKGWAIPYFNLIDNIFTQYGLPHELKYLAVIESNLKTSATSWVGAAGPWQFMPQTARMYGLKVDRNKDQRRDYFKSTHAAARMLLQLYSNYHDWLLVIAAYNGGSERVNAAINKTKSRDFWKLQYYLPKESRNHVKKFIATHYVMENNSSALAFNQSQSGHLINKSGVAILSSEEINQSTTQIISGKYNARVIAKNLNMDFHEFSKYNPDFDERLQQNGQNELRLPQEKMAIFLTNKYNILNECVEVLLGNENEATPVSNIPVSPKRKN